MSSPNWASSSSTWGSADWSGPNLQPYEGAFGSSYNSHASFSQTWSSSPYSNQSNDALTLKPLPSNHPLILEMESLKSQKLVARMRLFENIMKETGLFEADINTFEYWNFEIEQKILNLSSQIKLAELGYHWDSSIPYGVPLKKISCGNNMGGSKGSQVSLETPMNHTRQLSDNSEQNDPKDKFSDLPGPILRPARNKKGKKKGLARFTHVTYSRVEDDPVLQKWLVDRDVPAGTFGFEPAPNSPTSPVDKSSGKYSQRSDDEHDSDHSSSGEHDTTDPWQPVEQVDDYSPPIPVPYSQPKSQQIGNNRAYGPATGDRFVEIRNYEVIAPRERRSLSPMSCFQRRGGYRISAPYKRSSRNYRIEKARGYRTRSTTPRSQRRSRSPSISSRELELPDLEDSTSSTEMREDDNNGDDSSDSDGSNGADDSSSDNSSITDDSNESSSGNDSPSSPGSPQTPPGFNAAPPPPFEDLPTPEEEWNRQYEEQQRLEGERQRQATENYTQFIDFGAPRTSMSTYTREEIMAETERLIQVERDLVEQLRKSSSSSARMHLEQRDFVINHQSRWRRTA